MFGGGLLVEDELATSSERPKAEEVVPQPSPAESKDAGEDELYRIILQRGLKPWAELYRMVGFVRDGKLVFSVGYGYELFDIALNRWGWRDKLRKVLADVVSDVVLEPEGLSEDYVPENQQEAVKLLKYFFGGGAAKGEGDR